MAFDGITTKKIVCELNTALQDGKINKIYEPNKNEIILGIYAKRNKLCSKPINSIRFI